MRAIYVDGYRVEDGVGNFVLMLWGGGGCVGGRCRLLDYFGWLPAN